MLTAEQREHIRTARHHAAQQTRRKPTRPTAPKPTEKHTPTTMIEAQIGALHHHLQQLDSIVNDASHALHDIRAIVNDPQAAVSKWLEAERHIISLRQRLAELKADA